jgi:tetratricopeptide (TPR) repeat protein
MSRKNKRAEAARVQAPSGSGSAAAHDRSSTSTGGMRHRWLFWSVIVAFPILFLLLLELLLRGVGYGVPMEFALRREVEGELRYLSNPRFTWLFFEPGVARIAPPFSLAVRKPEGTYRVFVLGSSAAQGDPEPGFGMARMLDVLLRQEYPGVVFELVNAAPTAVNSHAVYAMARASVSLEPDLFVVYTGNNEVVGPYGAGTVLTAAAPSLALVRAAVAFRSTRLGQLVGAVAHGAARRAGRAEAPVAWHGMEMFLEHQVRLSDPRLQRTYRNFEANLADTCRLAHQARVPVILSTLAVNLRSGGPFGSLHARTLPEADGARWEELYRQGVRLEGKGRWADAADALRRASEIDAGHAEVAYRRARCAERLGRLDEAKRRFREARDLDTLRFRADARINAIVREVAQREAARGVRLADAERSLEEQSPHGTPGDEAFLDHVHLTFHGNYLVSLALLERIREVVPDWVRKRAIGRPVLGEEECGRRLVFTELDRYRIAETMVQRLREPPFTGQVDHTEAVERFSHEMEALRSRGDQSAVEAAVREYETALAADRPHWSVRERYATVQGRIGNAAAAAREWQELARQLPQYPAFHLQLARALRDTGRHDEAAASLRKVLEYQPDSVVTLVELARLALVRGRVAEAKGHARRAVERDPRDANALHVLATSLCPRGVCRPEERAEAVGHLTRALEIAPESEAVRRDLEALRGK